MGRVCGALVETTPFVRGVVGSTPDHVGTSGKFLAHNCLWCFDMKLRHSICAVSGAPLSISGLERRYRNGLNEMAFLHEEFVCKCSSKKNSNYKEI